VVALEAGLFTQFQPLGKDGKPSRTAISDSGVSGSWGGEITQQALIALIVFLVLVSLFIGIYFERNMALAALVALVHDVLITAGVYSLTGLEVTPATVIGLLTILGFSLYDTVVVFDKVQENTRGLLGLTRRTYPEAANLAVNQTLMRSINTSLIAVLPVLGLLIVGLGILGVGTLGDLALVQLVGLLAGSLSSILLATPLLVDLTMRRKSYRLQAQRVQARRASARQRPGAARTATTGPADAAAPARRTDGGAADDDSQAGDDLADELRHERAIAAATGVPARTPSQVDARRRAAATGGRTGRPAGKGGRGGKPAGKGGKPTGRRSH
jgi:preprotein translocase subunit SecF